MRRISAAMVGLGLMALPASAASLVVFSTDFEGSLPAEVTGAGGIELSGGFSGYGFGSKYYRNSALGGTSTVLSLTGLPAHSSVDLDFLLAVLDSWDGLTGGGSVDPDYFNVKVDGTVVVTSSYDQFTPGDELPIGSPLGTWTSLAAGGWADRPYDFAAVPSLSFPHSASTLTVEFYSSGAGFQYLDDESWAIDNLKVTVETIGAVPEGGLTAGLFGLGLIALGAARRRR